MGDILIDNQNVSATPSSGKSSIFVDSSTKKLCVLDDGGIPRGVMSQNISGGQQLIGISETYISNSNILIPSFGMKVGQVYQWQVCIEKSAAGGANINFNIRVGPNGNITDPSVALAGQQVAQAATASVAIWLVSAVVRSVGSSGVIVVTCGFASGGSFGDGDRFVSNGFNNALVANQYIGITITGGLGASYTVDSAFGYLIQ